MTDITELAPAMKAAAEKYRLTLEAHRNNPRDYDTVAAWDEATSEFMELVDSDELNIISGLVEALETKDADAEWMRKRIAELAKERETKEEQRANWFQMAQKLGEDLDAAEKRIAKLESRKPDIYLCRVTRNGEELYSTCGADYPRGTGYHRSVTVESRTVTVTAAAADVSYRNQPGMFVAVHIDAGDFVKVEGQVFEVRETDFDDHDVTLWFVGGEALKCAAGCQIEVVSAPEEDE